MKTLKNNFSTAVTLIIILGTLFFTGCKKDKIEMSDLDENILKSSELEEYIIAGADLQKSLAIFTAKMNKIDFSKLEVTYDAKGRKVVHVSPSLISNIRIEEKVARFNEKKKALQKNFPQFVSFGKEVARNYFKHSIKNSINVNGEFLKMGINFSRPRLKSGNEIWYGAENQVLLESFLYDWINSSGYVELFIIFYADGSMETYQNPGATCDSTYIGTVTNNGQLYFRGGMNPNSPIISIGHTHDNTGSTSTQDRVDTVPSGVSQFVYYNWNYYYY